MKKKNLILAAFVVIIVVVVSVIVTTYVPVERDKVDQPQPDEKIVKKVKVIDYHNWFTGTHAITDLLRPYVTTPLIEKESGGLLLNRFLKSYKINNDIAEVKLKDALLWSDKAVVIAQHYVDGWKYFRTNTTGETFKDDKEQFALYNLMKRIKLEVITLDTFRINGISQKEILIKLLSSRMLIPIRKDLLDKEQGWLVTAGPYLMPKIKDGVFHSKDQITLQPNPYYYRGKRKQPVKIDLSKELKTFWTTI